MWSTGDYSNDILCLLDNYTISKCPYYSPHNIISFLIYNSLKTALLISISVMNDRSGRDSIDKCCSPPIISYLFII